MESKEENSELVEHVLSAIIKVVQRRKSDLYAINTVTEVITNLQPTYPFLENIVIDDKIFSENWKGVQISNQVNAIDEKVLGNAINDVIKHIMTAVESEEDYYVIRQIQSDLQNEIDKILHKLGVSFDIQQFEYIVFKDMRKKEKIAKITNSEILTPLLGSLLKLVAKKYYKDTSINHVNTILQNIASTYDFANQITITFQPMGEPYYTISYPDHINTIAPTSIGEFFNTLLLEIGTAYYSDNIELFLANFKSSLSTDETLKIQELGINLSMVTSKVKQHKHIDISQHIVDALIELYSYRTSPEVTYEILASTKTELEQQYPCLRHVTINPNYATEHKPMYTINQDIAKEETRNLAKALQQIILRFVQQSPDKTLLEDFQRKLGDTYLNELHKIGVNLHYIELKTM